MKRKISIKALTALLAVLIPILSWADNSITYTATYDYSKLTLGTDTLGGVTYTTVTYEGLYNDGEPGTPSLPVDYIRFSVPYNATNFSVTGVFSNNAYTILNNMVYPCQLPRMGNDTTPRVITPPNISAYIADPLHPLSRAWVVGEGFLAGENHIVTVAIQPIASNYSVNHGVVHTGIQKSGSVQVTLSYDFVGSPKFNPIIRSDDSLRTEGHELTSSLVVNGNDVVANAPSQNRSNEIEGAIYDSIVPRHDYPYIIVTAEELKNPVRRIAALKKQQGYDVLVITIEDVLNHPFSQPGFAATDSLGNTVIDSTAAGKMRQFILNSYTYLKTKYVLLAGTSVPHLTFNNISTDFFFGEYQSNLITKRIDMSSELLLGRILATEPQQIDNYTDKLLRYELNPGRGDYSYLKRYLHTEMRFSECAWYPYIYPYIDSISAESRLMREDIGLQYPTGKAVIDSINTFRPAFLSSFNHGNPYNIMTYDDPDLRCKVWSHKALGETSLDGALNQLTNKYYPMVYYSLACETMPYETVANYDTIINFGESFTTRKDIGGPIYIGNTATVERYYILLLSGFFAKNIRAGYSRFSEAEALAKQTFNRIEVLQHNLLGDPTVEMWTDIPSLFSDINVKRENNSITVSGLSDYEGAILGYSDNAGIVRQYTIRGSNKRLLAVSPNASIMLFKHNYIPYIAPLFLQKYTITNSQYVIASDVTAGRSVETNRARGEVTVKSGVDYEIEASGTVRLEGGFNVEKGATFIVKPSCF